MKTKKQMKKRNFKMDAKSKILSKFTSGRTKAIEKRKRTLLLEYNLMNKTNKFIDRRIGERDRAMTEDDRVMARFVAQRVRAQNKKQMFNLGGEDEVLTHQGRNLQEIEKFDNPQSESEDEDEDGRLEADFVKKAHFGGGLFTKVTPDINDHRSIVDKLIAESKIRKAERQQTKEETQNLTEKLDNDLKELFPIFSGTKSDDVDNSSHIKPTKESYDVLVRELKFAPIGKPTNKLKAEDQIAKEEKKKLDALEKERLERMKRTLEPEEQNEIEPPSKKFQSADDLDDGFYLDNFDDVDDSEGENSAENDDNDNSDGDGDNDDDDDDDGDYNEADVSDSKNDFSTKKKISNVQSSASSPKKPILKIKTTKVPIVPSSLEGLLTILDEYSVDEKVSVIKNLVKEQRVHSGVSNKEYLMNFFNVLLEYIDSLFTSSDSKDCWCLASKLTPVLYELTQICGDTAAESVFNVIKRKQSVFSKQVKQEASSDMVIFLKLVPLLFPTSDFYHPVATPSTAFLCHILSQISCKTLKCISTGLFLATLTLEYVTLSNRYCPEAVKFLKCVLYVAAPNFEDTCPPVHIKNKILTLDHDNSEETLSEEILRIPYSFVSADVPENDRSKILIIYISLKLLSEYCVLYGKFSAAAAIWLPILTLLKKLPIDKYPTCIKNEIEKLEIELNIITNRPLQYLVAERKRPKPLRLYEPNIRPIIDGKSFRTVSQVKLEKEKLLHQYKREMKGALREIRKDRTFLAQVKLSEQAKRDAERKEKVKRIFSWGQNQQSEFKRMERQNRFKH